MPLRSARPGGRCASAASSPRGPRSLSRAVQVPSRGCGLHAHVTVWRSGAAKSAPLSRPPPWARSDSVARGSRRGWRGKGWARRGAVVFVGSQVQPFHMLAIGPRGPHTLRAGRRAATPDLLEPRLPNRWGKGHGVSFQRCKRSRHASFRRGTPRACQVVVYGMATQSYNCCFAKLIRCQVIPTCIESIPCRKCKSSSLARLMRRRRCPPQVKNTFLEVPCEPTEPRELRRCVSGPLSVTRMPRGYSAAHRGEHSQNIRSPITHVTCLQHLPRSGRETSGKRFLFCPSADI